MIELYWLIVYLINNHTLNHDKEMSISYLGSYVVCSYGKSIRNIQIYYYLKVLTSRLAYLGEEIIVMVYPHISARACRFATNLKAKTLI